MIIRLLESAAYHEPAMLVQLINYKAQRAEHMQHLNGSHLQSSVLQKYPISIGRSGRQAPRNQWLRRAADGVVAGGEGVDVTDARLR